jgi:hypothetical protein
MLNNNTSFLTESQASLKSRNKRCTVPLYHRSFPASNESRISDWELIYYIKIHANEPQQFRHTRIVLILREECL